MFKGCLLDRVITRIGERQRVKPKILILGLDNAGKTSLLYRLKLSTFIGEANCLPTVGLNEEEVDSSRLTASVWDVGGQDNLRRLWTSYYDDCNGVIFVVSSSDLARIQLAVEEFHRILKDAKLKNVPFLIFCNKQDKPNALTVNEIREKMQISSFNTRKIEVVGCSVKNGVGLEEGIIWLANNL